MHSTDHMNYRNEVYVEGTKAKSFFTDLITSMSNGTVFSTGLNLCNMIRYD